MIALSTNTLLWSVSALTTTLKLLWRTAVGAYAQHNSDICIFSHLCVLRFSRFLESGGMAVGRNSTRRITPGEFLRLGRWLFCSSICGVRKFWGLHFRSRTRPTGKPRQRPPKHSRRRTGQSVRSRLRSERKRLSCSLRLFRLLRVQTLAHSRRSICSRGSRRPQTLGQGRRSRG